MPRPRKPTSLHLIQRTFRPHRHDRRAGEPIVLEPLGDPPGSWAVEGKILWAEIKNAVPGGVATKADRLLVELTVRLTIHMREGNLTPALAAQLRACLGALGMTPADRSKLSIPQPPPKDGAGRYLT